MADKELEQLSSEILGGLEKAYVVMVKNKKKTDSPLIISKGGKVKSIPAEDIPDTTSYEC